VTQSRLGIKPKLSGIKFVKNGLPPIRPGPTLRLNGKRSKRKLLSLMRPSVSPHRKPMKRVSKHTKKARKPTTQGRKHSRKVRVLSRTPKRPGMTLSRPGIQPKMV